MQKVASASRAGSGEPSGRRGFMPLCRRVPRQCVIDIASQETRVGFSDAPPRTGLVNPSCTGRDGRLAAWKRRFPSSSVVTREDIVVLLFHVYGENCRFYFARPGFERPEKG